MDKNVYSAFIDSCREDMIEAVRALVSIPSVEGEPEPGMPYGKEPYRALMKCREMAEALGFRTCVVGDRVLEVDLNDKEPELGIIAHLDIVAADGWKHDPFTMRLENGVMIGRGVADDKGPLVSALWALKAVKECAPPLSKGVRLLFGTAEETSCDDLAYYMNVRKMPPYSFAPDAHYPVHNTEKGIFTPKFSRSWAKSDSLPRVAELHGGRAHNAVPASAEARLLGLSAESVRPFAEKAERETEATFTLSEENGSLRIMASGKSNHVCRPWNGCNAQTALLSLLAALPLADIPSSEAIRALNECFPHGDHYGEAIFPEKREDELTGPLSVSFSVLSLTEEGFTAQCDCRCPLCCTQENTAEPMLAKLRQSGFTLCGMEKLTPGHHTPADSPLCTALNRVYEEYTGLPGACEAIGGFTYVHNVPGGVAFGAALPGVDPHFHAEDEWFSVDDMLLNANIFAAAITELCR